MKSMRASLMISWITSSTFGAARSSGASNRRAIRKSTNHLGDINPLTNPGILDRSDVEEVDHPHPLTREGDRVFMLQRRQETHEPANDGEHDYRSSLRKAWMARLMSSSGTRHTPPCKPVSIETNFTASFPTRSCITPYRLLSLVACPSTVCMSVLLKASISYPSSALDSTNPDSLNRWSADWIALLLLAGISWRNST